MKNTDIIARMLAVFDINYLIGLHFYKIKNWNRAEEYFKKAMTSATVAHAYAFFKYGMCKLKQGDWSCAYENIVKAVRLNPVNKKWQVQLKQSAGRCFIQSSLTYKSCINPNNEYRDDNLNGRTEEELIQNKIDKNPDFAENYAEMAIYLSKENKYWQSAEFWNKAISLTGKRGEWHYLYGNVCEQLNRWGEAVAHYKKAVQILEKRGVPAEWYYKLGYSAEMDHKPENQSVQDAAYKEAILLDEKYNSKEFGIGAFHIKYRRWNKAIKSIEDCLNLGKIQNCGEAYYKIGFAYDRLYQWEDAAIQYGKALKECANPDWIFRYGYVNERMGKFLEASNYYSKAARLRERYTPYWFYRSAYCLEKIKKYKESCLEYLNLRKSKKVAIRVDLKLARVRKFVISNLKLQLEQDCTNAGDWYYLGTLYEYQKDYGFAEECYRQAVLRSNDLNSLWRYRLGYVLFNQGKYAEACESFRNYRALQRPHGESENILGRDIDFAKSAIYCEYYKVLSVRKNIILYESFAGQGMTCNPYAIFLYLFNCEKYKNFLHVWVVNKISNVSEKYKKYRNIIFIQRDSDAYLRYLSQAAYLINNSTFPPYFIRKENQIYLNTWHGTAYKTLGRDMKGRFFEHKNFTRNILQSTHLLSPNSHMTHILNERHDVYEIYSGKLLESGYPRVDLTLNANKFRKLEIKEELGLRNCRKVVLYAPTWRGTHGHVGIDSEKLRKDLETINKLDNIELIFRGHALLQEEILNLGLKVKIVPASIDTNELLSVVDILITDYSSIMFDFMPTRKNIILYVYDYDQYVMERGVYFNLDELPGLKCHSIDEVCLAIKKSSEYIDNKKLFDRFVPYEDGCVTKKVVEAVFERNYSHVKVVNKKVDKRKSLLIYGGPFMGNGITTSLINLISNIDRNKYNITVAIDPGAIMKEVGRVSKFSLLPEINVVARVGRMNLGLDDKYIHSINNHEYGYLNNRMKNVLVESWHMEFLRIIGQGKFDSLIQFEGYNCFWTGLFASQNNKKILIFMHNSMIEEYGEKYAYLRLVFWYCGWVNKVISVSKLTRDLNRKELSERFDINKDKFEFCDNVQNPKYVLDRAKEPLAEEDAELFNGKTTFINIGRLSIEKDQIKLIKSFYEVYKEYKNCQLLIIGEGMLKQNLIELVNQLNLKGVVFILGSRSNPYNILSKSDCFVLSSNHEGQPMTLFEAMILNKPIISTDIVGSRSALQGRAGLLVENSVTGLKNGMLNFLTGKFKDKYYDIYDYQKNSLLKFSQLVN